MNDQKPKVVGSSVPTQADMIPDFAAIQERRTALYHRLLQGATGTEMVESFSDFIDVLLIGQYRHLARKVGQEDGAGLQQCCLVAVGGYGRRELAPFSDIDVMMLYRSRGAGIVTTLSKELFHHLWDLGFQVGHSMRSIAEALSVAEADVSARTALMEARFLAGNAEVFQYFQGRFGRRLLGWHAKRFIQQKVEERKQDYRKFGETVYLLEPNVKKSKGGLRDFHLLQWAAMAKYRATTLQELANRGLMSHQDYLALLEAREFLWHVRSLMHFQAGRAQDILSFDEQVRLATQFGFQDQPHLLAVEQFMQMYYRHTQGLHDSCMRFVDRMRETGLWRRRFTRLWPSPLVEKCFQIEGTQLTIPGEKLLMVLDSPVLLIRLFSLAQEGSLIIDSQVLDELPHHLNGMPNEAFHIPAVTGMFRDMLSTPGSIADTLGAMHRAHLLEKLIPAFSRVRGLMQFNQYHKYTVDEHSLLAVRQAERMRQDSGIVGKVYHDIHRKDILHLALLLHDLGKGREEDHSEVGKDIAKKTTKRLGLDPQEGRVLEFLVHKHLLMPHIAFRRDLSDEKVILNFAREVKTPEVLKKLLILTMADIAAVGPETMNKWKESLLVELFHRTMDEITGDREGSGKEGDLSALVEDVSHFLTPAVRQPPSGAQGVATHHFDWIRDQLRKFPNRYLRRTKPETMAIHLEAIGKVQPQIPIVEARFHHDLHICQYHLVTYEEETPGIFMKITGVLAAMGLHVLDAQIVTRSDGLVVDTFSVSDPDYQGSPPVSRLETVSHRMIQVLMGKESIDQIVVCSPRVTFTRPFPLGRHPTEVQIDNETSDLYTVIDVFADDKQGLLHIIARTLCELGLSVRAARIGTQLDQAVDVFDVAGANGRKVEDAGMCENIQTSLQKAVDQFLDWNL